MSVGARTTTFGAYVCPRGVCVVHSELRGPDLRIERTMDVAARLDSPSAAAEQLVRALDSLGAEHARVAIALRGFGMVHHVLLLPSTRPDILEPIIDREVRRLEPQMTDAVIAWAPLSTSTLASAAEADNAQLAGAVPAETVDAFARRLGDAGHTLVHVTALPASIDRVVGEFDPTDQSSALVASLPDGPFLALFLGGALRLVIDPPADADAHDASALAEEAELGSTMLRQQFGVDGLERVTMLGAVDSVDDAEPMLTSRLGVPVRRFALRDLSAAAHAAVGSVLDAHAVSPLSFGGETRREPHHPVRAIRRRTGAIAAIAALFLAAWTMVGAVRARDSARELEAAQRRVEQESTAFARVQSTTAQRTAVRAAERVMRLSALDHAQLQRTIVDVAAALATRVRIDSMTMSRAADLWAVHLHGIAPGSSASEAVQMLHDFYGDLARRAAIQQLSLDRLAYVDSPHGAEAAVRFEISFAAPAMLPSARGNR